MEGRWNLNMRRNSRLTFFGLSGDGTSAVTMASELTTQRRDGSSHADLRASRGRRQWLSSKVHRERDRPKLRGDATQAELQADFFFEIASRHRPKR
jgi:hypothetical protein